MEIDSGGTKLKDWKRPVLFSTAIKRFLNQYGVDTEERIREKISGAFCFTDAACPECLKSMKIVTGKLPDGNEVCYLQCNGSPDINHGYGHLSKHRVRAPQGRVAGKDYSKKNRDVKVEIIKEEQQKPKEESIKVSVTGTIVHPEIIRASRHVIAGERNIYLTGPAGTGKSTGAEHLYEIMRTQDQWKASVIHKLTVSLSTFVSDLAGFVDRLNKGEFVTTELVEALQKPGVVVVDEADKGNPNLAGFWNVILANKEIMTPGGMKIRHDDNVVVFIGNTTGHQPSKQYSGSVRQDFATLDRFRCFNVGFDEKVERAAVPNLKPDLYAHIKRLRKNAESSILQRILGTRWLRRVNNTMIVEGINDPVQAIKTVMRDESWSNDEIQASGV